MESGLNKVSIYLQACAKKAKLNIILNNKNNWNFYIIFDSF